MPLRAVSRQRLFDVRAGHAYADTGSGAEYRAKGSAREQTSDRSNGQRSRGGTQTNALPVGLGALSTGVSSGDRYLGPAPMAGDHGQYAQPCGLHGGGGWESRGPGTTCSERAE
jgi:hypothetical protein